MVARAIVPFPVQRSNNVDGKAEKTRGGAHDPLPRFTLQIPNYSKYNPPLKKSRKRTYVQFECDAMEDEHLWTKRAATRAVFYELVMRSHEGHWRNVTVSDIGKRLNIDYRTIIRALDELSPTPLILVTGEYKRSASTDGDEGKRRSNAKGQTRHISNESQVGLRELCTSDASQLHNSRKVQGTFLEETRQPADQRQQNDAYKIRKDISPKGEKDIGAQAPSLPRPDEATEVQPTPFDRIFVALVERRVPHQGADPAAFYRAMAGRFMQRKPTSMTGQEWASWVCRAINAVPADDRWQVRVNDCLKTSTMAGQFVSPEFPTTKRAAGALSEEKRSKLREEFKADG